MSKIIVIGTSGHAAEIQEYLHAAGYSRDTGGKRVAGFLDDDPEGYGRYRFRAPYLGPIKGHRVLPDHHYIMGIANLQFRRTIVEQLLASGASFLTLVHPTAYVSESATIGTGTILGPMVNVGPNVVVGNFNLVNSRCSLAHDTRLGDFNFLGPNVSFSGETVVGDENLFGVNCATKPGVLIGTGNKVEAGMIVDKSIGDNSVVFYRYKEKVIAIPKKKDD